MNSQHSNHPNDNSHANNDGQPVSPNASTGLNRSDNFIDTTEDGLFDFDLEDLENFFNANIASSTQASINTAHTDNSSQSLPALDLSTTSLDTHGVQTHENHIAPTHTVSENTTPEHANTAINFEKSWETPSPEITPATTSSSSVAHEPMTAFDTPKSDTSLPDLSAAETVALGTTAAASVAAAHTVSNTSASAPINETKSPTEPVTLTKNTPTNPVQPEPVPLTQSQPTQGKKGFFSSFTQEKTKSTPVEPTVGPTTPMPGNSTGGAGNGHTPPPMLTATKKTNKNNKPLLILLGLLGVGALAWLASQFLSEPEPAPAQKPIPAPKAISATAGSTPTSAVAATSGTVATSAPIAANSPATVSLQTAASSTATSSPLGTKTIKPEEILATPLPKDNAVAKEEIDRLADQSKQLSQQEKMMEEQLKMMNELSSKKEERIALLEKQIAQIEAQKGQAKK